jgi:hypothetical protein
VLGVQQQRWDAAVIDPGLFNKLILRDNDIIVLRADITDAELEALTIALHDYMSKASLQNVLFIQLRADQSIRTISDEEMWLQGWRRR